MWAAIRQCRIKRVIPGRAEREPGIQGFPGVQLRI
jgi:hypothetical protein